MQPMEHKGPRKSRQFTRLDLAEIAIGAFTLILPLVFTQELWDLGRELPLLNVLVMGLLAYGLIAGFVFYSFYEGNLRVDRQEFVHRVGSVYAVTLLVAAASLLLVDKFPLVSDPVVALKRTVLASLPGSFLATVVDGLQ